MSFILSFLKKALGVQSLPLPAPTLYPSSLTLQDLSVLKPLLIAHEGDRGVPYVDTRGNVTAGIGRNLTARPIAKDITDEWFLEDVNAYHADLMQFEWYKQLTAIRQYALIDMCFMGFQKFLQFKQMIQHLVDKQYAAAADEVLNSDYHEQVGKRADDIAYMLRNNDFPIGLR